MPGAPVTSGPPRESVQLVASLLVLIWAVRLGGYLLDRILRMKVDHRFDEMWVLHGAAFAVVMGPVFITLSSSS